MFENVNGRFVFQHLEHQIVEAEWNTGRYEFKHCGIHAVDAHAYEIGQIGLLAEPGDPVFGFIDHAKVHLRDAGGGSNGKVRAMSAMKVYEVAEVEIGKYIAVENQEWFIERLPHER